MFYFTIPDNIILYICIYVITSGLQLIMILIINLLIIFFINRLIVFYWATMKNVLHGFPACKSPDIQVSRRLVLIEIFSLQYHHTKNHLGPTLGELQPENDGNVLLDRQLILINLSSKLVVASSFVLLFYFLFI